jgi:hypothetical protein
MFFRGLGQVAEGLQLEVKLTSTGSPGAHPPIGTPAS